MHRTRFKKILSLLYYNVIAGSSRRWKRKHWVTGGIKIRVLLTQNWIKQQKKRKTGQKHADTGAHDGVPYVGNDACL